jgi:hypothetical protein
LASGCGISDYMSGDAEKEQDYSLLTENASNETEEAPEAENATETAEETEAAPEATEEAPEQQVEMGNSGEVVIKVFENDTVELKPQVNDPDMDNLTYTFTEPLDKNGVWKTNFGDAGQYKVTVGVSDGKNTVSKAVVIMVQRLNVPPTIEPIKAIVVDEGDTVTIEPKIEDPNGDEFEVVISDPVGDDGEWEIDYKSAGNYTVVIKATDIDGAESKIEIPVKVNKKNVAPIIEGAEDITIDEGDLAELELNITDPNGDDVKINISDPVGNDMEWQTGYTDHGEYTIIITATDGQATSSKEIKLIVNDINMAPEIIDIINSGAGYVPECAINSDCDDNEKCASGLCVKKEIVTAKNETTSEETNATGETAECEDDNDCEGDLICVKGVCEEE